MICLLRNFKRIIASTIPYDRSGKKPSLKHQYQVCRLITTRLLAAPIPPEHYTLSTSIMFPHRKGDCCYVARVSPLPPRRAKWAPGHNSPTYLMNWNSINNFPHNSKEHLPRFIKLVTNLSQSSFINWMGKKSPCIFKGFDPFKV